MRLICLETGAIEPPIVLTTPVAAIAADEAIERMLRRIDRSHPMCILSEFMNDIEWMVDNIKAEVPT